MIKVTFVPICHIFAEFDSLKYQHELGLAKILLVSIYAHDSAEIPMPFTNGARPAWNTQEICLFLMSYASCSVADVGIKYFFMMNHFVCKLQLPVFPSAFPGFPYHSGHRNPNIIVITNGTHVSRMKQHLLIAQLLWWPLKPKYLAIWTVFPG